MASKMDGRKMRKAKQEVIIPSIEEVVVKTEVGDDADLDESLSIAGPGNVKKASKASKKKAPKQRKKKKRAVGDGSEDIEQKPEMEDKTDEDEPANLSACEQSTTHCRFCLRQVAAHNLQTMVTKHKTKALATFRVRILPEDPFLLACVNCLNLLDIFVEFRETIVKSKKLLARRVGFMNSDGWDSVENVRAFDTCRTVVIEHKKQIFEMYDKYIRVPKEEPKENVEMNKVEKACDLKQDIDEYNISDIAAMEIADATCQSEELQVPATSLYIEKVAVEEQCQVPATTLYIEEVVIEDQQPESQNVPAKWDESDHDFEPDGMDIGDDDYEPEIKKTKPKKSKPAEAKDKPAKPDKIKPKGPQNKYSEYQKLCDICGERLSYATEEGHKNQHLGIKPYKCPHGCDVSFYSRFNQMVHVRRYHKGPIYHECDICKKMIRGKTGALNQHKKIHTKTEKDHVCNICGKGFTLRHYLIQHAMVHDTELPHKCSYCGKRFSNKWSMRTHERNIHEKKMNVSADANTLQNVSFEAENFDIAPNVAENV